jgi:hypothetical protein
MSQGGSLGDHDFATGIDFDVVVIGGIWIAICLGNAFLLRFNSSKRSWSLLSL